MGSDSLPFLCGWIFFPQTFCSQVSNTSLCFLLTLFNTVYSKQHPAFTDTHAKENTTNLLIMLINNMKTNKTAVVVTP